jgi:hypothetical protein
MAASRDMPAAHVPTPSEACTVPSLEERIQRRLEAGLADKFSRGTVFALCANEWVHVRTAAPGMPSEPVLRSEPVLGPHLCPPVPGAMHLPYGMRMLPLGMRHCPT